MKKSSLIAFLILVGLVGYGQGVGIYYTKNGAKLTGDKPESFRIAYDQGFAVGVFYDISIADEVVFSIQPGYQKIQSVVKIPGLDGEMKDTLKLRLDYFSLPLLFKIKPQKTERFYFIGGPQIGFLLESNTTNELGEEQDRSQLFNDLNVTLNFGFGYKIPIKSLILLIEAKYEQGLVNVTDFGNSQELFSRVKTQGVNLTLGLGFPFRSKSDE
jgi:hypothetical protein